MPPSIDELARRALRTASRTGDLLEAVYEVLPDDDTILAIARQEPALIVEEFQTDPTKLREVLSYAVERAVSDLALSS